jgi:uncharacterized protein
MKFSIGTSSDSKSVKVDAMVLADTRALINASSGLGKSWLLRLIAENVASKIQTIIIDPEGEFATLREALDLLIVGENADLRADIRSAGLLARKLAETGVSAVVDIYDLPGNEDPWVKRRMFVALFLSELMNLPKKLYHPMLVMVDEAHQFAQEEITSDTYMLNGKKVNPSMISRSAVRSMMSAGRKRGIGGILATQRISKIDKDAIADARNVFIGGTTLDNDQKRAGDILGMSKAEAVSTLRDLDPGMFFAFGPAIDGKGIVRFTSAAVKTTHPKAGQRSTIVVPKASTQIAGIVQQFGDLPAIADEEVKTIDALKREIADLARQLRARPTETRTETQIERVEVPILPIEEFRSILESLNDLKEYAADLKRIGEYIESYPLSLPDILATLKQAVDRYAIQPPDHLRLFTSLKAKPVLEPRGKSSIQPRKEIQSTEKIGEGEVKILNYIAQYDNGVTPKQLTVLTGYKRSTRNTYLQRLGQKGMTEKRGERIFITDVGRQLVDSSPLPTGADLRQHWFDVLPQGERAIFEILLAVYPKDIDREEIGERTGFSRSTRNTYIQRMHAKELVTMTSQGRIRASELLFDE